MSSNLVIAAIPDENDRVWKISSEKIPHLTLLFLGDVDAVSNLDQIMLFVEHAARTSLKRFYLPVDRRGKLGDDKADVLFFKKGRYDYKAIRDFRATLLQDQNIKTAYDSSKQFDGPWQPHLTLGYPTAPAKPLDDNETFSFFDVSFNKIAVWTGDFEGPDFLLKDYGDELDEMDVPIPMDVAMSALIHVAKVSDTPWSQFKDSDYTDEQYARACLLDRGEDAGTAKQRYGLPVREPSGTVNRNACHAAAAVLSSKGGTGSARGSKVKGSSEQIAEAKKKLIALYKNTLDEDVPKGLGGEMKQTNELGAEMAQTADLGSEFLAHYGVKGMRWGQRKSEDAGGGGGAGGKKLDAVKKGLTEIAKFGGDVNFETESRMTQERSAIINDAHVALKRTDLPAIKEKHGDYGKMVNRAKKPFSKEARAYRKDVKESYIKRLEDAANLRTNSSRTRQYTIRERGWELPSEGGRLPSSKHYWDLTTREIPRAGGPGSGTSQFGRRAKHDALEHADETVITTTFEVLEEDGYITGLKQTESNTMAQTADLGATLVSALLSEDDDVLAHYGTKGMRWGVRNNAPTGIRRNRMEPRMAPAPTDVRAISRVPPGKRRKTKIETDGGENHPASDDAIKVAVNRTKLHKSGPKALSNKELQEVANRIELEARVKRATQPGAQKFISNLLRNQGNQQANQFVQEQFKRRRTSGALA